MTYQQSTMLYNKANQNSGNHERLILYTNCRNFQNILRVQPQPDGFDPPDMAPIDDDEVDEGTTTETYPSLSHSPVKEELMSERHQQPQGRIPNGDHEEEIEVPLSLSTCEPMKELKKLTNQLVFNSGVPICVESETSSMPSEGGARNQDDESLESTNSLSVPREDLRNCTPRAFQRRETEFQSDSSRKAYVPHKHNTCTKT